MEEISYALGVTLGNNLKNSGFSELDFQKFSEGIKDVIQGGKLNISVQDAQSMINEYFQQIQEKAFQKNIQEGKDFLTENAKRAEVVTTESGLQYEVVKEGKGSKPKATDSVTVHYHGTLLNGNVFDSSVNRGEPATFGVTQVIQGWVEALQLMTVGSKWKLFVPSELAYGSQGAGQSIEPHTTLIFEVELIDIV